MRLMKSILILDLTTVLYFRVKQKVVRMYSCPETEEKKVLVKFRCVNCNMN